MKMMTSTPLQYRSQVERNFGWPMGRERPSEGINRGWGHTSDVPNLERDVPLANVSYVEPDGWYHFLAPLESG